METLLLAMAMAQSHVVILNPTIEDLGLFTKLNSLPNKLSPHQVAIFIIPSS